MFQTITSAFTLKQFAEIKIIKKYPLSERNKAAEFIT